jgi:hypothetical protein
MSKLSQVINRSHNLVDALDLAKAVTITWASPVAVNYQPGGFKLTAVQLNATCEPPNTPLTYDPPLGTLLEARDAPYVLRVKPSHLPAPVKQVTLKVNKARASVILKEPNAVDYVAGGFVLRKEQFIIENLEPSTLVLDYDPPLGTKLDVKKGGYSLRVSLKQDNQANKNYRIEGEFSKPVTLQVNPLSRLPKG